MSANSSSSFRSPSSDSESSSTRRYQWSNLWPRLKRSGWRVRQADIDGFGEFWVRPGKDPSDPSHRLGVDYFDNVEDVRAHQMRVDGEEDRDDADAGRVVRRTADGSPLDSERASRNGGCDVGSHLSSKRRKLVEPDMTVIVGEGAESRAFLCHKLVLRLASEVFDNMFSHDMKEKHESTIELKCKKPSEWELFYSFVDPETAGLAQIDRKNVFALLPWFHEYGMASLVCQCDRIIAKLANAGAQNGDVIHYSLLSHCYELRDTKASALPIVTARIENGNLMLDQELISSLRPLLLSDDYRSLWLTLRDLLPVSLNITDPKDFFDKELELSFLVIKEQRLRVMEEVVKTMPKFVSQLPSISYEGRDRVKKAVAKKLGKELKGVVALL